MGAIILIVIAVLIYGVKILNNSHNLTFDKWSEIFISFFIFTNCLNFGLTLFETPGIVPYTDTIRIEVFMIITPVFFILLSRRNQWKLPTIHWMWILVFVAFAAINIFNPNNLNVTGTIIAIFNILSYFIFLYIISASTSVKTIIRGIYEGLFYVLILEGIIVFIYTIGVTQIATFFREEASIRSVDRPGAPGTFAHPNPLGIYMSYVYCFFLSCYLLNYQKRKSLWLAIASVAIIIPTFSRSSLGSILFATIILVSILSTKNSSIFSVKNIFTRILPIVVVAVAAVLLSPLRNSFIGSNMDEMMFARLLHYYCGFMIFSEHPFIGVGFNSHVDYMTANFNFRSLADVDLLYDTFLFSNPIHNIWLIWLCELGILGTLVIIGFFGYQFYKIKPVLRSQLTTENKIASMTTAGIICCFLVQGMGDPSPLSFQIFQMWMIFVFLTNAPQCREISNETET